MGGDGRRVACRRGAGGPWAGLFVRRRSVGVEPARRRDWTGESRTDVASVENLGDMVSSCVGNWSAAGSMAAGRPGTGAAARVGGDAERPAGQGRGTLRGGGGGPVGTCPQGQRGRGGSGVG